ncbi:alpha/beta hydrolase [Ruegeria sp. HKCCA5491]|uniref:lipase/acyltransferase domain-containing protein n=1 Tax=Ruegeria sp. HKCCA5491 TaxID=2682986 RepID=UPI001488A11D
MKEIAYGRFFSEQASDPGSREYFHPFSYDWRASNVLSARKLGDFLCEVSKDSKQSIILIAHSMGGLVVKHWLMDRYKEPCDNGEKVKIGAVIFAATPHTGSPKSLLSLIDGTDLFGIEAIDAMVLSAVNKYG